VKGRKILQRGIFWMEDSLFYLLCTSYVGFQRLSYTKPTWQRLLKKDDARREEEQFDADLTARGYQFHGLKLAAKLQLIRQNIMEKDETTNGEFEVDMTKYFKLLSSDVNETIFKEE
jgi:hypothetical protein